MVHVSNKEYDCHDNQMHKTWTIFTSLYKPFPQKKTEPNCILFRRNVPLVVLFQNPIDCRLPLIIMVTKATKSLQPGKKYFFASFKYLVVMTTQSIRRKQQLYDGI